MNNRKDDLAVHVWGPFACFTRPEYVTERVSYPIITPPAAAGLLSAIFWKPEFAWHVREVWVMRPIRHFSILRNEVNSRQSERSAASWQQAGGGYVATDDRAQRHTLALRDIAYVIKAQIEVKPHAEADPAKYRDQFRRRVNDGRCFATPYLGCREFLRAVSNQLTSPTSLGQCCTILITPVIGQDVVSRASSTRGSNTASSTSHRFALLRRCRCCCNV